MNETIPTELDALFTPKKRLKALPPLLARKAKMAGRVKMQKAARKKNRRRT